MDIRTISGIHILIGLSITYYAWSAGQNWLTAFTYGSVWEWWIGKFLFQAVIAPMQGIQ